MALLELLKRKGKEYKKFFGIREAGAGTLGRVSPDIEAAIRAFEQRSLEPLRRRGEEVEKKLSVEELKKHPEEVAFTISPGALSGRVAPKVTQVVDEIIKDRGPIAKNIIKEITSNFYLKAKTQLTDRFAPIKNIVDEAKKKLGREILPDVDPYVAARLYQGINGKIQNRLEELGTAIKKVGTFGDENVKDLSRFLLMERIAERTQRGFKNPRNLGINEVKEFAQELATRQGKEGFQKIKDAQAGIKNITNNLLKEVRDAGIISQEAFATIRKQNQKYVPFDVLEYLDEAGGNIKRGSNAFSVGSQNVIKTIQGTVKDVADPLEALTRKVIRTTKLVERNKVARNLFELRNVDDELRQTIRHITSDADQAALPSNYEIIHFFDKGQKVDYAVPKELADAMLGLTTKEADIVTKTAAFASRIFRAGVTSLNAAFFIPNTIRDVTNAKVIAKHGLGLVDFVKGFSSAIKKDKLYKEWRESGGAFSTFISQYRALGMTLKDITEGKAKGFIKTIINPVKLLGDVGQVFEEATRLGVFRRAIKRGAAPTEAGLESRAASVDFAKSGTIMKVANAWVPFLNARLQGTLNLGRALKERPGTTILKASILGVTPTVLTYLHNRSFPGYWDISQWERDNNIIIMRGSFVNEQGEPVPSYFKIPKGDVIRIVSNPLENFLTYLDAKDTKAVTELALEFFSDISPIPFEREGKLNAGIALSSILPPPAKVSTEIQTNFNLFTQRKIIPRGLEEVEPAEQFKDYTPEVLKKIGKAINVSPLNLEHMIRGTFGEVGRQVVMGLDLLLFPEEAKKRSKIPLQERAPNIPLLSRFIGGRGGAIVEEQFKEVERLRTESATQRVQRQRQAKEIVDMFSVVESKEERFELWKSLKDDPTITPEVEKEIIKIVKERDLKITFIDKSIKALPTKQRAEFIIKEFVKIDDEEKRRELLTDLIAKKILTPAVEKEIVNLRKTRPELFEKEIIEPQLSPLQRLQRIFAPAQ